MSDNDESYDIIIVGSGGGGLVGGYVAASRGLRTLIIEKTDKVGGTTSYSGGGTWYPGSAPIARAGIDDSVDAGREYLRAAVNDPSRTALQDAYISAGIDLIDELEKSSWFPPFEHLPVPDYFADLPGATPHGRTVFPQPIPVAELGDKADLVRRSIYTERYGHTEDETLLGGRALIGRALAAFLDTGNGVLELNTALSDLIVENDRIVGVEAVGSDGPVRYTATKGVLLATGGFEHNTELREKYQNLPLKGEWSDGVDSNTGDGLMAGIAVGGDTDLLDEAWYVPGTLYPDGKPIFQSGIRSGIWVNAAGKRFVNESRPYDQAGHVIRDAERAAGAGTHAPAYWILDHKALSRDGFGGKSPETPISDEWFASGSLQRADTLEELAELIGVPADALTASVETFNGFVPGGVDGEFHRGETPWDQMVGYIVGYAALPEQNFLVQVEPEGPNHLLTAVDTPPYYAATIVLSDIGTKGGLKTDVDARVLRPDGRPIEGLYATGNTMAAMSGTVYPGAGTPIGSTLAFAYRAVRHIAGD
ncbi:FAD-dependent oxidoreductase [Gordonia sp. CPCC 206044]|uniref:FAD-dependent oxidoreductase n=1 Tax=Gordonia sp. CPCC 206044 TaxID=3140793 RepID=UPI003AF3A842